MLATRRRIIVMLADHVIYANGWLRIIQINATANINHRLIREMRVQAKASDLIDAVGVDVIWPFQTNVQYLEIE